MREELRIELSELCEGNPGVRKRMLHFSTSEDVAFTSISDLAAIVGKDPTDSAVREVADELLRYFSSGLILVIPSQGQTFLKLSVLSGIPEGLLKKRSPFAE